MEEKIDKIAGYGERENGGYSNKTEPLDLIEKG